MALPPLVLVVDDEVPIANMICETLERQGLRVSHCQDAAQALIQAEALKPSLVITDIMMPVWGSGIDAYHRMRSHRRLKDVPIIFLTGMRSELARNIVPIGDPKSRLLFKPVSLAHLLQSIRDLTGDRLLGPAAKPKGATNG